MFIPIYNDIFFISLSVCAHNFVNNNNDLLILKQDIF